MELLALAHHASMWAKQVTKPVQLDDVDGIELDGYEPVREVRGPALAQAPGLPASFGQSQTARTGLMPRLFSSPVSSLSTNTGKERARLRNDNIRWGGRPLGSARP
ncbi:hypothetical protein [Streptomyces sp. NPDC054887]